MSAVDLDDTTGCPSGAVRCEGCGTDEGPLTVRTAWTPLGVMCLSLCLRCAASGVIPPVSLSTAMRFVGQHCEHLGIDLDEMAAAMEAGQ